jgi:predicted RNase H-like HicB family nuclease
MLVKLEAYHDGEFWCARGIGASVFTQGKTFEKLLENAKEALALHFEEKLEEGETLQVLILTETEIKSVSQATVS